jgi:hypothetical protein
VAKATRAATSTDYAPGKRAVSLARQGAEKIIAGVDGARDRLAAKRELLLRLLRGCGGR